MKAVIIHTSGDSTSLQIETVPEPTLKHTDVLIKVAATALNRADLMQKKGMYPPPAGASEIMGLEVAGTVVKTGKNTQDFQEGDKVMALLAGGGYAEYVAVDEG